METIALDVHAHLAPILPDRLAALAGVRWEPEGPRLVLDGHAVGLAPLFRPEALRTWMDRHGVRKAWISIPPPLYRAHLEPNAARLWAAYVNDGLVATAGAAPDRFEPLLHLPAEHPELADEIARDWIAQGHARFAMAAGAGPALALSDARYDPLWQALDAAAAFLFLHPGESCDPRLDPYYLHNLFGNPTETGLAAAHLVLSGILARHPRLQVCLAHAGGTAPAVAGRLERGHATARPGVETAVESPKRAFRRLSVDCIAHDPAALALAAEVCGADNVLFGSDWPFPMGLPEPHAQLADIDHALRRRIFVENAARVLRRP